MIETHELTKQFHDFLAVDEVNLSVDAGQILAILGQNGAGKTTTVRMLTALLNPTRGWARVAGYDVVKNGHDVRSSVGVLTEQHGLYMRMTAIEYLDFFGQVYSLSATVRKARSDHLLEYFGLTEAARRRIGEYSKGMRQKLALARAMMHDPEILILDEPTAGVDVELRHDLWRILADLNKNGKTIFLTTHYLEEAQRLCERIGIIFNGKIVALESKTELIKDGKSVEDHYLHYSKINHNGN